MKIEENWKQFYLLVCDDEKVSPGLVCTTGNVYIEGPDEGDGEWKFRIYHGKNKGFIATLIWRLDLER